MTFDKEDLPEFNSNNQNNDVLHIERESIELLYLYVLFPSKKQCIRTKKPHGDEIYMVYESIETITDININ